MVVSGSRYDVRPLSADDFEALEALERDVFGAIGEPTLCVHYLRMCTDIFADTCFFALDAGRPVGYLLGLTRGREAWCSTLAVREEYRRTRVAAGLVVAFVGAVIDRVDVCWFTVKEGDAAVRRLHARLGAIEVGRRENYYGRGDHRVVSRVDRATVERLRARYGRLGFVGRPAAP